MLDHARGNGNDNDVEKLHGVSVVVQDKGALRELYCEISSRHARGGLVLVIDHALPVNAEATLIPIGIGLFPSLHLRF